MRAVTTLACAIALLALVAAGCGDDDSDQPTPQASEPPPEQASPPDEGAIDEENAAEDGDDDRPGGGAGDREPTDAPPRLSPDERAAIAAVRDYIAALDARDSAAVCAALAPGAIDEVKLPRDRGGCAASLEASVGYRDPRGLPVWQSSRMIGVGSFDVAGETARVVATVRTRFADRDEPSIEDDIVHLARSDEGWLVAKSSATLYRAVGIADVPPSVLAPP
jgi:hypothetical protein